MIDGWFESKKGNFTGVRSINDTGKRIISGNSWTTALAVIASTSFRFISAIFNIFISEMRHVSTKEAKQSHTDYLPSSLLWTSSAYFPVANSDLKGSQVSLLYNKPFT